MAAANSQISMLVTSCARHDLLRSTLESFYACVDLEPQEVVIFEDSDTPMPDWLNSNVWRGRNVRWVSDGIRRGQAYACARLIDEAKYPFVLWWEDDWYTHLGDFIQKSKEILQKYPRVIQVSLRGNSGWHPLADPDEIDTHAHFKLAMPYWHGVWGGWSWNPGLRRKSELREVQRLVSQYVGTVGLEHEKALSKHLLDAGWRIADLNREIVTHTGDGRSRAIEQLTTTVPKVLIAVPACFAFEYSRWESEDSPHFNRNTAYNGEPYGKDIHISGPNPRIDVVRDTWAKDAQAFPNVDVRFFYGHPQKGFPRTAREDEVFLSCPDDYAGLPKKTMAICEWAAQRGYDFMLKCDDDTYVWVDRALREIMQHPQLDYGGWLNGQACSGGVGYWLSKRAIREVVRNPMDNHWAEDVTVAKIMDAAGINPIQLVNHRPGFGDHWFFPQGYDSTRLKGNEVTIHAVQPEVMRAIYDNKEIMGRNSHNTSIDEFAKAWRKQLSDSDYDLAVLTREEFVEKYKITDSAYAQIVEDRNARTER